MQKFYMKTYQFLFYKIYKFTLSTPSANIAEWSSIISISFLLGLNIMTGYYWIFHQSLKYIIPEYPKFGPYLLMSILLVINYMIFLHRKKYLNIVSEFDDELQNNKNKNIFVLLYVIITFILFLTTPSLSQASSRLTAVHEQMLARDEKPYFPIFFTGNSPRSLLHNVFNHGIFSGCIIQLCFQKIHIDLAFILRFNFTPVSATEFFFHQFMGLTADINFTGH